MQLKEIFYYALFTISMTVTCAQPDNHLQALSKNQTEKRITKREAAIFVIDSFPGEPVTSNKPKSFYKTISRKRYHAPTPSHGPPRGKIRPMSNANAKKHYKRLKKIKSTYSAPSSKKRFPKPWQAPTGSSSYKQGKSKPIPLKNAAKRLPRPLKSLPMAEFPGPRKRKPIVYSPQEQEPIGFGEPPANYQPSKFRYQEPPVDSYGAPLRTPDQSPSNTAVSFDYYDIQESDTALDYANWNNQPLADDVAFTNNYPSFVSPSEFGKYEIVNDFDMDSKYNDMKTKTKNIYLSNKDLRKLVNKPWTASKLKEDDKVMVGGQYAEPPARYVPLFQSNKKLYFRDSEKFSPDDILHMDYESTVSPYVNYKNSNMAFSPQNLNDAFSME